MLFFAFSKLHEVEPRSSMRFGREQFCDFIGEIFRSPEHCSATSFHYDTTTHQWFELSQFTVACRRANRYGLVINLQLPILLQPLTDENCAFVLLSVCRVGGRIGFIAVMG